MHSEICKIFWDFLFNFPFKTTFKNSNILIQTEPLKATGRQIVILIISKGIFFGGENLERFLQSVEKCRVHVGGVFRQVTQVESRRATLSGQLLENWPPLFCIFKYVLIYLPAETENGERLTCLKRFQKALSRNISMITRICKKARKIRGLEWSHDWDLICGQMIKAEDYMYWKSMLRVNLYCLRYKTPKIEIFGYLLSSLSGRLGTGWLE